MLGRAMTNKNVLIFCSSAGPSIYQKRYSHGARHLAAAQEPRTIPALPGIRFSRYFNIMILPSLRKEQAEKRGGCARPCTGGGKFLEISEINSSPVVGKQAALREAMLDEMA